MLDQAVGHAIGSSRCPASCPSQRPISHTIATRYRDWMVRCQVINFQLRYDFQHARKDVWSMIVELRHLVFEHIPRCDEELDALVREQLEQ